jgi:hypothetical protein
MPAGSLGAMLVLRAAPQTSRHWRADCEAGTLLHYICQRHHEVRMSKMETVKLWLLHLQFWYARGSSQGNEGMMHPDMPTRALVKAHDLGIDWLSAGGVSRSTWKGNFCPGRFGSVVVEHLIKLLGASIGKQINYCHRLFRISFFSRKSLRYGWSAKGQDFCTGSRGGGSYWQ